MPKFLCRTFGQSAGFGGPDTTDMDSAIVELTTALIHLLRKCEQLIRDLQSKLDITHEIYVWHSPVEWLECFPCDAEDCGVIPIGSSEAVDDREELVPLADESAITDEVRCRSECGQMIVGISPNYGGNPPEVEFGWCAYRKNCDVLVTTPRFTLSYLESLLQPVQA